MGRPSWPLEGVSLDPAAQNSFSLGKYLLRIKGMGGIAVLTAERVSGAQFFVIRESTVGDYYGSFHSESTKDLWGTDAVSETLDDASRYR